MTRAVTVHSRSRPRRHPAWARAHALAERGRPVRIRDAEGVDRVNHPFALRYIAACLLIGAAAMRVAIALVLWGAA